MPTDMVTAGNKAPQVEFLSSVLPFLWMCRTVFPWLTPSLIYCRVWSQVIALGGGPIALQYFAHISEQKPPAILKWSSTILTVTHIPQHGQHSPGSRRFQLLEPLDEDLQRGEGHVHAPVVGNTWAPPGETSGKNLEMKNLWKSSGRYGNNWIWGRITGYLENIWTMDTVGGRNHKHRDPFGTCSPILTHRSPVYQQICPVRTTPWTWAWDQSSWASWGLLLYLPF